MRTLSLLLLGPLALGSLSPIRAGAQTAPNAGDPAAIRWNRLIPTVIEADAAARRAARTAVAGDAEALRRLSAARPPLLMRTYGMVSVAQYAATRAASDSRTASVAAAVASASAAVLMGLYRDSAAQAVVARTLAADLAAARSTTSYDAERIEAGMALGAAVAQQVLAGAPQLEIAAPWEGTIPTGPGRWFSAPGTPPLGITFATATPWLLTSPGQFRPGQPPAFASPAWKAALAEVHAVARSRTAEQVAIAQRWNAADPWAHWNERASALIRNARLSEREAARVLAVMNAGAADAMIACFEAKYHYWTIRPTQADSTLTLAPEVRLPNFPSFPSGHACSAGAFEQTLVAFFPTERAALVRVAEEQAMSRLYAGVHYRFDNDAGLALGRTVARYALERDRRGGFDRWQAAPSPRRP